MGLLAPLSYFSVVWQGKGNFFVRKKLTLIQNCGSDEITTVTARSIHNGITTEFFLVQDTKKI